MSQVPETARSSTASGGSGATGGSVASAAAASASSPADSGEDAGYQAVLLAGFGGPEGPDDVMPFLRTVTRGRGVPDERLEEVAQHYLALGGVSPINAQTRALRTALAEELDRREVGVPVLWGNRNWDPYLADTVRDAREAGRTRLLAVATSAYSSYSSCRQYREDFARALVDSGSLGIVTIDKVRPYFDLPGFLQTFADGLVTAVNSAAVQDVSLDELEVVFTTHSIPLTMADRSGTPEDGSLYVAQHLAACAWVIDAVADRLGGRPRWRLAYQSRSGPLTVPWLEPDVNDVLGELSEGGCRGVIVVPIGFVSDHVEVIWDLDTEAASTAAGLGMWYHRVATPGTDPRFVSGLADLLVERLDPARPRTRPAVTLAARPDACPAGCCRGTAVRPTTAGVDSAVDWLAASSDGTAVDPALLAGSGVTIPPVPAVPAVPSAPAAGSVGAAGPSVGSAPSVGV
jgi:ferrochelatase